MKSSDVTNKRGQSFNLILHSGWPDLVAVCDQSLQESDKINLYLFPEPYHWNWFLKAFHSYFRMMISQTAVTSFYTDEEQEHLKPILVLDTSVLSPTPFSTTLLMSILPNSFLSSSVHFLSSEFPRTPTEYLLSFLKLYFASKPYFYSSKYVLSSSWPLHLICTKNTSSPLSYLKAVSCDFFVSFRRGPLSTHFTWSDTDVSPIFSL